MRKHCFNFVQSAHLDANLLGSKGANLAEMLKLGLHVPPGFTLTTEACNQYFDHNQVLWSHLIEEIEEQILLLESQTGKGFGDRVNPLLISVRSGSVISMPGMMDTILNLGLNDDTVEGLAKKTDNPRFAYDSYRRFIEMYSEIVNQIPRYKFERQLEKLIEQNCVTCEAQLTKENLMTLIQTYKDIYLKEMSTPFPSDVRSQLLEAIKSVFNSWNNHRAIIYRNIHEIPHHIGTAVTIQSMVFGNMGQTSGTGVLFTRNPSTGENVLYGEFLMNAQGEDVVAGIRTPQPIHHLHTVMPDIYEELNQIAKLLEMHYNDMQDIEFTIENEKLYILQTRKGKRTGEAAIVIAVELVKEGKLSIEEALMRIEPNQLNQLLHPMFKEEALKDSTIIAKGLAASPGAASGKVVFHSEDIVNSKDLNEQYILVRMDTSPEDIEGMNHAAGILTTRGGMTSHAAVVARGMGICCVSGCSEIIIDEERKQMRAGSVIIHEGDVISLNGSTGHVYLGEIALVDSVVSEEFAQLMSWAELHCPMNIRVNADTSNDVQIALNHGADGIGLCRTEHMFFNEQRISVVRKMILSLTTEERALALATLLPMQKEDFIGIFKLMADKPCTIRLLDPPLHEFLPKQRSEILSLSKELHVTVEEINRRTNQLHEQNPMLGHRGCRLGITYPEIYNMQVNAIIEAAIVCVKEGIQVHPEIMIPLIGDINELKFIKAQIINTINDCFKVHGITIPYLIGTMIEVPRAAITAHELAKEVDFFSFGTNDLTQMTFGFSRDDVHSFLPHYYEHQIFEKDPFQVIDVLGVGQLIEMAIDKGRSVKSTLKIGVCGEHGGDPTSLRYFHTLGLNYVSCSPYRVPIARLALAQYHLEKNLKVEGK